MNTIIVDDEINAIRTLEILIKQNCPDINIIGTATSVEEAVLLIHELKPKLVFMDIDMPTGSGFQVVEQTSDVNYQLIFTTAYNEYAHQAFKVNAIDYLLKPIDETELINAVEKVIKRENVPLSMSELMKLINRPLETKISISSNEGFHLVNVSEIIRVESDSNYTWIHFTDKNKILVSKTLKDIEKQLERYEFIRVHNSHLINQHFVAKYIKHEGGYLIMQDGSEIPISRRKKVEILRLFE